jgi:hypothetical protein
MSENCSEPQLGSDRQLGKGSWHDGESAHFLDGYSSFTIVSCLVASGFMRHAYSSVRDLCLSNEPNILDLDANVGLSARFWRMMFPNAFIMAVEPDRGNIAMCRRNMKGHESRFALIEACAGGERRRIYLESSEGGWGIKMRETGKVAKFRWMY